MTHPSLAAYSLTAILCGTAGTVLLCRGSGYGAILLAIGWVMADAP